MEETNTALPISNTSWPEILQYFTITYIFKYINPLWIIINISNRQENEGKWNSVIRPQSPRTTLCPLKNKERTAARGKKNNNNKKCI